MARNGERGVSQYFYDIAEEIPDEKWKDVARHLGLKGAKISAIDAENRYLKEKNMKTLDTWRMKNGSKATVDWLRRALCDADLRGIADSVIDGITGDETFVKTGIQEEKKQQSSAGPGLDSVYNYSGVTVSLAQANAAGGQTHRKVVQATTNPQPGELLGIEADMAQLHIGTGHPTSLEHPIGGDRMTRPQGNPQADVTRELQSSSHQFFHTKMPQLGQSVYPMVTHPRGHALIVNNSVFDGNLSNRKGADVDVTITENLLKSLGFRVVQLLNKSAKEMLDGTRDFSQRSGHKDGSCCILFLMSHGQEGSIIGKDGQAVMLKDIFSLFDNVHCQHLLGKPKLFFIQACRGANIDRGTVAPRDAPDAVEVLNEQSLPYQLFGPMPGGRDVPDAAREVNQPTRTDMFFGYATQEGNMAFRNETQGSWFVQAIDQVFRQHAKDTHVADMMTMVNRMVAAKTAQSENSSYTGGKESSEYLSNLQKNLFFFPGL